MDCADDGCFNVYSNFDGLPTFDVFYSSSKFFRFYEYELAWISVCYDG